MRVFLRFTWENKCDRFLFIALIVVKKSARLILLFMVVFLLSACRPKMYTIVKK